MTEGWPKEESRQKMRVTKEIVEYKHKDPLPSPLPLLGRGSRYKKGTLLGGAESPEGPDVPEGRGEIEDPLCPPA